ncbi:hypothetical protein HUE87_01680 [Candidatus Sulfurimonas marisnigri]|uniref:Indole-3-glycerol-phosphate synthase n=1 Tax=Candidatus Sulfurimonas marisnigri TaxID=2740405 RepID=A0A7S7M0T4_9BACT|nr:hypothetical protein [Candidatus Sulfurimonas marisnigri]QOY54982.1 hypothetical protein HUE87_01680 [Candidatus Sulfurimonas marisnigri]
MLFFGHRFITSENFYHIPNIDAIKNTPPSSTLYVEFSEDNLDIIKHTIQNSISLAVEVINITQIVYASALGVAFIIVPKELAKTAQNLAENYLFDAKILVYIEEESEIEELAILGVDGVICSNAIIKINS